MQSKHLLLSLPLLFSLAAGVCTAAPSAPADKPVHKFLHDGEDKNLSAAYQWLDIAQEATARDVDRSAPRPTVISRTLAIWATAMYDAWAAYDEKAVGSRLGDKLRRPEAERTLENKKKAIAYASFHALNYVYPADKEWLAGEMKRMGYDASVVCEDAAKPEGVGYLAAKAVIDYRRKDGANQHGDEPGCSGVPYSDYTGYKPVNPPDKIVDPDRWQPIEFTMPDGKKVTPGFLTPQWGRVKPFMMEKAEQFRPGPPPKTTTDDATLRKETEAVLKYNNSLTNEQKATVEFMRDGPRSTGQSGHWLRFAQDVSRRDKHDLDKDVKLYFIVANVAMDAFISCWETKLHYDSSRPWTLIHYYYKGKKIIGWAGPDGGTKEMLGEDWHPYSPISFITPPFPGYTSGHATVSGACAKILELFTGSDEFGFIERRPHCELTEKKSGEMVTLDLKTWTNTANMAALSRAMGGYHIPVDNDVGLKVGRELAVWSFPKYAEFFNGTAKVRP